MSQLGVATYKFDEIGEFTYCLLLQGDRDTVSQSHCCSVVVQRTAKVPQTTVKWLHVFFCILCFISFDDYTIPQNLATAT